ncbi:MAG: acyltransferase family protein [Fusobacteriaceae bacterium]
MQRDSKIDSLKGIGIFLVVLGHHNNFILRDYIYSFHMPLFFFISGYLHKIENNNLNYLKRKIKLVKKYFLGSFTLLLFWIFIGRKVGLTSQFSGSIIENIIGIFYGTYNLNIGSRMDWGVQMWFIPTIILTGYFCNLLLKKQNILLILMVLIIFNMLNFKLPFNLENIIFVIPFYLVGYICKVSSKNNFSNNKMILIISIILGIIAFKLNGSIDIRTGNYKNLILFYLASFTNIYVFFYFFYKEKFASILKVLGVFSLEIMIFHLIILKLLKGVYLYGFGMDVEKSLVVFPILNTFLQIGIIITSSKILIKLRERGIKIGL